MELVSHPKRIVVVGEGMVELSEVEGRPRVGYGGDALNTAIHLARFGLPTAFMTALGSDKFSDRLKADWSKEGLDTDLILTDPERHPGLYAVHTDGSGERSFTYWRDQSAARRMFELPDAENAVEQAQYATLLYFSLISLAVLPPEGRQQLLDLARDVRDCGGRVAFDSNYRPRLWEDVGEARQQHDAAIALCDIGLPTLEDEQRLADLGSAEAVREHFRSLGAWEVVVKLGGRGALVDQALVPPPDALEPVDTTGAGDAFNAAYLAARLHGADPLQAAMRGHALAAWVVMRAGAIPPVDGAAPYNLD